VKFCILEKLNHKSLELANRMINKLSSKMQQLKLELTSSQNKKDIKRSLVFGFFMQVFML